MTVRVNIKKYQFNNNKEILFSNLNFSVNACGFYLITGQSGIGKSTLMKIMLGLFEGKFDGEIHFDLEGIKYTSDQLRRSGKIGYQSDDFSLIPWKNIKENIFLPSIVNKNIINVDIDKVNGELNKIGLNDSILDKYPHELSFGMKARVGIVRACLWSPSVIFLDELFSGIDSLNNQAIIEYLRIISQTTIIFAISHQIIEACKIACTTLLINNNRQLIELTPCTPELIFKNIN